MWNLLRTAFGLVLAMALFGSAASADQKVAFTLDKEVDAYLAASEKAAEKAADNTLKAFWKDGLRLETADKKFKLKMGGRIMFDFGFLSADDDYRTVSGGGETAADDYAFFRRARLYVEGTIHGNVIYKAQYDFSKSQVTGLQDMLIGLQKTSLCRFRIGHMKAPAGLERLSSSKYLT
ncbi:MAG: porin, partial [Planctomycetota bacterium]